MSVPFPTSSRSFTAERPGSYDASDVHALLMVRRGEVAFKSGIRIHGMIDFLWAVILLGTLFVRYYFSLLRSVIGEIKRQGHERHQGGIVDLRRVVSELKQERDRLNRAIAALEGIEVAAAVTTKASSKPASKKAKKHNLTAEGRKRLSEMMKKRWAERKRKLKLAANHRQAKAA